MRDKYRIFFVYKNLSKKEKSVIIKFWEDNNALQNREIAEQRVDEISTLTLDADNKLIAVSTVYPQDFTAPNNIFFFLRIFIQSQNRGNYNLGHRICQTNFKNLKNIYSNSANGLVIELENKKLEKLGENTQFFQKKGYCYWGKSPRGLQIWYARFDNPTGIFKGL